MSGKTGCGYYYSMLTCDPSILYTKSTDNVGFDIRGDVKVFDFGLVKSLDDHLKAPRGGYGYNLTAFTGSIPYVSSLAVVDVF